MSKDCLLEPLRRLLENPTAQSGLYLIDTELDDKEIEACIRGIGGCSYVKGSLIPTIDSSVFELFVIKFSHEFESEEIKDLRKLLISDATTKRDNVILSLLVLMMKHLGEKRKTIIHMCGETDLSSMIHEDLYKLNEVLTDLPHPIIIVNKKKSAVGTEYDPLINIIVLKEERILRLMEKRTEIVHISYKHDAAYENAMNAIKAGLERNGIQYSIDEYDIMYRDNIDDYEKEIGASDIVIMFVIPNYLKSLDCMFEMTQMFKNGNVKKRIFPVVDMGGISRNGDSLKEIKDYWQGEKARKTEQIKTEPGGSTFVLSELMKIDDILKTMDDLWMFLCREFSGSYEKLIDNDAALLMEELKKSFSDNNTSNHGKFVPTDATQPADARIVNQNGGKNVYIENVNGDVTIN